MTRSCECGHYGFHLVGKCVIEDCSCEYEVKIRTNWNLIGYIVIFYVTYLIVGLFK